MKKSNVLASILIATMAFSVTACSSKSEKGAETTVVATTEAATEATTSAEIGTPTEAKASDTQAVPDDGTIDAAIVGTWGVTFGEGEDEFTMYYTFNEDGSGDITSSDPSLVEQSFTYTTKADKLIMKSSEIHSEEETYKIDGDTLTTDDGIQVTTYTRS